jgi:adenosylcobinamide-phosphate synthase
VVAPVFWFAILGLPGLLVLQAINTADSMIGHLTPRQSRFRLAAARLDDLVNLPASRLAGGLIALAAAACQRQRRARLSDHDRGRGETTARPNAGWPEAAWRVRWASRWRDRGAIAALW